MNTDNIRQCPKCQASVEADAPQGLCPKCLLAAVSAPTDGGQASETRPVPELETVAAAFPQLEILAFIGQGGMGLVYKARQPKLDRLVALKLLPQTPGVDPAFGERFNREARVLARLGHPNIVAVHDFGQAGQFFYLVMEFVDGVNLRQAMRAGRFTPAQALALVPKVCDALQYAHEEGVLHRDIKPENLLLDTRGRVKIADFGIAKLQGAKDITLTASGAAMGTPHYMAPEQLEHPHDVDQRADIYSLGVVFYEMLTGELPIGRFAPPSEKSTVDTRVDEIVMRTLEKERELRFQSAGEVKTQVEYVTSNPAPPGGVPKTGSTPSGQAPSGDSPPPPPADTVRITKNPPRDRRRWSKRAVAGFALVALSIVEMFFVVASHSHPGFQETLLLCSVIGGPALLGLGLTKMALDEIAAARDNLRGERLAMLTFAAWPLLLVNVFLWACLRGLTNSLFTFFGNAPAILGLVVICGLNSFIVWALLSGYQWERTRIAALAVAKLLQRAPRKVLWIAAVAIIFIVFLISRPSRLERRETPAPVEFTSEPALPPGYYPPQGSSYRDIGHDYQTQFVVPGGYALTITATLSSNQVVVSRSSANHSAFILAQGRQQAAGILTWRLLAGPTLADGAPLEFSIRLNKESGKMQKTFHLTPPEPITIDWVGVPKNIWPPQNGRTKHILFKGVTSESGSDRQSLAEWCVGIETRLDPIPEKQDLNINQAVVGLGSNWLSTMDMNNLENTAPELVEPVPMADMPTTVESPR